jgi:hypothetical protein
MVLKLFGKKGDIGYAYIIMIVLGILGIVLILFIFRGGFGQLGEKLLGLLNQTAPAG